MPVEHEGRTLGNQTEFAEFMGFAREYVTQLKKKKDCPLVWVPAPRGGKPLIDFQASKERVDAQSAIDAVRRPNRVTHRGATDRPASSGVVLEPSASNITPDQAETPHDFALVAMEGKSRKDYYAGLAEQMAYEAARGKYVEAEEVKRAATEAAITIKNALRNIPARLAPQLAGVENVFEIHRLLEDEIFQTLAATVDILADA